MNAPSDQGMKKQLMSAQMRNASCNTRPVIAVTIAEDHQYKDKIRCKTLHKMSQGCLLSDIVSRNFVFIIYHKHFIWNILGVSTADNPYLNYSYFYTR